MTEFWNEFVENLSAPSPITQLIKEEKASILSEPDKDRVQSFLDKGEKEKAKATLKQEIMGFLEDRAKQMNKAVSMWRKEKDDESTSPFTAFAENLRQIRYATGKTQTAFLEENLASQVARSTYGMIEEQEQESIKSQTIERIANALGVNPRILLINENMLRTFQESQQNASIFDIIYVCSSSQKSRIHEVTSRNGMSMSPPLFHALLEIMPLQSIHDPSVKYGMVCGWRWGRSVELPDEFHPGEVSRRFASAGLMGAFGNFIKK